MNNLSVQNLYDEERNYSFSVISDNKTLLKKLLEVWPNYTKTIFEDDKSQEEIDKCYKKCIESVFKDSLILPIVLL